MPVAKALSTRNYLLNALPPDSLKRLLPRIESVDLPLGATLYKPYDRIEYVYFPNNSMASIVANSASGQATEIGVVGCEGAVGVEVLLGSNSSPHESMIQIADGAHRIAAKALRAEFEENRATRRLLLAFVNKLMVQISQTTLCNRIHSVDERLSRWLLMCDDRIESSTLALTQEFLAIMLGVSRVSVTLSASDLQAAGVISYSRGHLTVLDREALEKTACECYKIVKAEYDRTECDDDE